MPDKKKSGSGSSERLPSFKGPRDLSLLSPSSSLPVTALTSVPVLPSLTSAHLSASNPVLPGGPGMRPKRIFKPNIPPRRNRGGNDQGGSAASSTSSSSSVQKSQQSQAQVTAGPSSATSTGPSRGRGRGRGRGALIQADSVFAEGVGDPLSIKATRTSSSSRGAGQFAGASHKSRAKSSITTETLKQIKKEAEPLTAKTVDMSDVFEDDMKDLKIPPEVEALQVPLNSYVENEETHLERNGQPSQKVFANLISSADENGSLAMFQLPSELPVLLDQESSSKEESRKLTNYLGTLPEGFIGKIQIMASGKVKFVLGENVFDISSGKSTGFRQDLTAIDLDENRIIELGKIDNKFVITPDISQLLSNVNL